MNYLSNLTNRVNGGFSDFPRSVDDLFQRFWGGALPMQAPAAVWRPAVDVIEAPDAYLIRVEIPGIDPESIDVTLTGDTLTVRGEKPVEQMQEDRAWRLRERLAGTFERSFTLPLPVASEHVEADARHGVLTIRVAKAAEAQPKKIAVRKA